MVTEADGYSQLAPLRIEAIAAGLGLGPDDVEPFGWHKGKLALGLERRLPPRASTRYIGVTAVSPTPLGEGKTVTAIGLAMALCRLGCPAITTVRQPSQGAVFGIKGGGAGGGRAARRNNGPDEDRSRWAPLSSLERPRLVHNSKRTSNNWDKAVRAACPSSLCPQFAT